MSLEWKAERKQSKTERDMQANNHRLEYIENKKQQKPRLALALEMGISAERSGTELDAKKKLLLFLVRVKLLIFFFWLGRLRLWTDGLDWNWTKLAELIWISLYWGQTQPRTHDLGTIHPILPWPSMTDHVTILLLMHWRFHSIVMIGTDIPGSFIPRVLRDLGRLKELIQHLDCLLPKITVT